MKYKENYIKNYLALYVYMSITNRDAKKQLNKEKALNYTYNSINPRELKYSVRFLPQSCSHNNSARGWNRSQAALLTLLNNIRRINHLWIIS